MHKVTPCSTYKNVVFYQQIFSRSEKELDTISYGRHFLATHYTHVFNYETHKKAVISKMNSTLEDYLRKMMKLDCGFYCISPFFLNIEMLAS